MKNQKSLFNGLIIIDIKKLEQAVTIGVYLATYIIHKLLIATAVIMLLGTIGASGDGKYYDGNIKIALICIILFIVCCILARITGLFLKYIPENYKARALKHAEANMLNCLFHQ